VRWLVLAVLLACRVAHADAGPCAARAATCRVLDRAGDYAAIVIETGQTYTYAIVARDRGGWSRRDGASFEIYLDGDMYLAGNCCWGTVGTPRFAFAVHDGVAILRVDLPLHRFYKPGWGSGEVAPAYFHREGVACSRAGCTPLRG
jgi:hypothetical protein